MNQEEDTCLLSTLARAMLELSEVSLSGAISLPYPPLAQHTLDRIVRLCLERSERPPTGIPELVSWCTRRTPSEWPFPTAAGRLRPGALLVDPAVRRPTRTCFELAGDAAPAAREALRQLATTVDAPSSAQRARNFLIDHPVVTDGLVRRDPAAMATWKRVKRLYEAPTKGDFSDRRVATCPGCGLLAHLAGPQVDWCEAELCPRDKPPARHRADERVRLLIGPLRLFLSLPGRTERQLGERLAAIGVGFRLVDPIEGTHELDRPLRGKRIVHVADRIEPGLLAIDALRWPESLVVVPQRLFDRVAGYRETFTDAVSAAAGITLLSDDELVGLVIDAPMEKDDA